MDDYFSILPLPQPLDRDGVRRLARQACSDLYRVKWLGGFLAVDGLRMLCSYRAPDAESVRFVLRQQGSTGAVWPAELSGASVSEPLQAGREAVAVEFEFDARRDAQAAASTMRAVSAGLEAQGFTVGRAFAARYGERFVVV